jgi:hypothetical protein
VRSKTRKKRVGLPPTGREGPPPQTRPQRAPNPFNSVSRMEDSLARCKEGSGVVGGRGGRAWGGHRCPFARAAKLLGSLPPSASAGGGRRGRGGGQARARNSGCRQEGRASLSYLGALNSRGGKEDAGGCHFVCWGGLRKQRRRYEGGWGRERLQGEQERGGEATATKHAAVRVCISISGAAEPSSKMPADGGKEEYKGRPPQTQRGGRCAHKKQSGGRVWERGEPKEKRFPGGGCMRVCRGPTAFLESRLI